MRADWQYHFFDTREEIIAWVKEDRERVLEAGITKSNYNLTLEEAIAIMDEQHRIVQDWFKAGKVDPEDFIFNINKA